MPILVCSVAACGGGGGGGSVSSGGSSGGSDGSTPPAIGAVDFVRFNQTDATIEGKGFSFNYTENADEFIATAATAESFDNGRVVLDYNALGALLTARFKNNDVDYIFDYESETYDYTYVDAVLGSVDPVTATSNDEMFVEFDANDTYEEEYGEFGVWDDDNGTTGNAGVVVYGDFSSADQIPDAGTATYSGFHGGVYTDGSASTILTTGDFDASVNFATRAVTASLSNTRGENDANFYTDLSVLDFSGTFTGADDWHNGFSVTSSTGTNGVLSGTTKFYFMGPNAEELAGHFEMRNAGNNSTEIYAGGFWGGQ